MSVYNTPAPHASHLAAQAGKRTLSYAAGALAVLLLGWFLAGGAWLIWGPVVAVLAGLSAHENSKWGKARIGVKSETSVAKSLARSNCAQVLINSALLGAGGDADHVLLGPCAVVVETKTGFGNLNVRQGRVYSGNRPVGKNEMEQVQRQARALSRLVGAPAMAVVCVADAKGNPKKVGDVWVCNSRDLPGIIKTAPAVLDGRRLPGALNSVLEKHRQESGLS